MSMSERLPEELVSDPSARDAKRHGEVVALDDVQEGVEDALFFGGALHDRAGLHGDDDAALDVLLVGYVTRRADVGGRRLERADLARTRGGRGGDATLLSARARRTFSRARRPLKGGTGMWGEGCGVVRVRGVGGFATRAAVPVGFVGDQGGRGGEARRAPEDRRACARGVRRSLSRAGGRARRRERRASVRRRTCAARRTGARARGASLEAGLGGPPGRQTLASTKLLAQTASPSDESAEALAHAAGAKGPFGGCGSAVVRATRSAPRRAGVTSFSPRFSRRGPHGPGKKQLARDRTLTQE